MTTFIVPATILRVHDADTLAADLDLGWHIVLRNQPIRLAHCNAPELATPAGKAALAFVNTLVKAGDQVTLMSHSLDKYGRVLASVQLPDGRDLAATLVTNGFAAPWDGKGPKP